MSEERFRSSTAVFSVPKSAYLGRSVGSLRLCRVLSVLQRGLYL